MELCVAILAIQYIGEAAMRAGEVACKAGSASDAAFDAVYNVSDPRYDVKQASATEWFITNGGEMINNHNFQSDIDKDPIAGPWVVAVLDHIDTLKPPRT